MIDIPRLLTVFRLNFRQFTIFSEFGKDALLCNMLMVNKLPLLAWALNYY